MIDYTFYRCFFLMARINKSSTALVNTIAGDLLVQSESTALFDLMNSLNVKIDSMSTMTDKMNALRAVSAVVASRRDEYEKTAPEYVRLNVLKVSVIDRLLEIFQEEYVALEKRLDFFNRKINGWNMTFYEIIVSFVGSVMYGNIFGAVISVVVGLYILFQVKSYYH